MSRLLWIGIGSLLIVAIIAYAHIIFGYNNYTTDENSYCVPLFEKVMEYCVLFGKTVSCHESPTTQKECRIMNDIISNTSNNKN